MREARLPEALGCERYRDLRRAAARARRLRALQNGRPRRSRAAILILAALGWAFLARG